MSSTYLFGALLIGTGAFLTYLAGRRDAEREAKQRETDTWTEANSADDSKMGAVADVRVKPDRLRSTGDSA